MKAAILVEQNKPLEIAEVELPPELAFGQVLVTLHYTSICGAQINEIQGAKGPDRFLPHLLGHEGSGVVDEIGPGVSTVKPGDHVVLHWRPSAGIQSPTPKYTSGGKTINAGWVTTFNDRAIISENRLTVIPPDFDMKLAPLFGCAVTTAVGVINNDAGVTVGQSVVVFGVGGVGLNICQIADLVGANPVIGVDLYQTKLDWAARYGATHGFVADENGGHLDEIRAIVGEKGADVVIDTTGSARVIEIAYELTHPDGKTILVGVPRKGDKATIYTLPLHFKKVLTGSHGGSVEPDVLIPRLIGLVRRGKLTLDGFFGKTYRLEQINQAIDDMKSGQPGRCLIDLT